MSTQALIEKGLYDRYEPGVMWLLYVDRRTAGRYPLGRHGQEQQRGYLGGIRDVLAAQLSWGDLTEGEALRELRKGTESIFHPLFKDDPRICVDCPKCRCRVVIGVEGICDDCGHEFEEGN